MNRRPLFVALAMGLLLGVSARPVRANCHLFDFFGFFDYRRSLDPQDDPCERERQAKLEHRLHYVFHHMTAAEAQEIWSGRCRKAGRASETGASRHDSEGDSHTGTRHAARFESRSERYND